MMIRLLLYGVYAVLTFLLGYFLYYIMVATPVVRNIIFVIASAVLQYLLTTFVLKTSIWKNLTITFITWILSFAIGELTLVHYVFDRHPNHADLYGLIAFWITMFTCYEVYIRILQTLQKQKP